MSNAKRQSSMSNIFLGIASVFMGLDSCVALSAIKQIMRHNLFNHAKINPIYMINIKKNLPDG
jgi:hypothetical protein